MHPLLKLSEPLVRRLRPQIEASVRALLLPRFESVRAAQAETAALGGAITQAEVAAKHLAARLDRAPITAATTVHAAHARHPGVRDVFARRGLPACPECAVGFDETVAEAALSEGLGLDDLLTELNNLLR